MSIVAYIDPTLWLQPATPAAAAFLLFGLLLTNVVLSALFAVFTHGLLPRRLRGEHAVANVLALTALGGLLPVLGPLLLLLVGLLYPLLEKGVQAMQPTGLLQPTFATEMRAHPSHFGAGGGLIALRGSAPDNAQSARALLAIETRRDRETTELLSAALSHPDETLRLLAHNLLTRREETLIAAINRLEKRLALEAPDAASVLRVDLAELHLEFLYLDLVSGSLKQMHIETAQRHLDAIGEPPADAAWRTRFLVVRARLNAYRQTPGSDAAIRRDYAQALAAGAAPARALPWLLERAWRARDYAQLRRLAHAHEVYPSMPRIGPVITRWRHSTHA